MPIRFETSSSASSPSNPSDSSASNEMSKAASLLRLFTPKRVLVATRPIRAHIKESKTAAGFWTFRKRIRFSILTPRSMNQKLHYKMAWDRRTLLHTITDKVAVRGYVQALGRPEILNEVFAVVDDPQLIDLDALPARCVIKPTHGSGAAIVIHDQAEPSNRIPINFPPHQWCCTSLFIRRENIDRAAFNALCNHWLGRSYWRSQGATEWAYLDIPPRIMVEKYLEVHKNPLDYRFFVIDQRVAWFQVHRYDGVTSYGNAYSRYGAQIPFEWALDGTFEFVLPLEIGAMVTLSEELAKDTDFVRVDLYLVDGKIFFSELTNYPNGGRGTHNNSKIATALTARWRPPKRYR